MTAAAAIENGGEVGKNAMWPVVKKVRRPLNW